MSQQQQIIALKCYASTHAIWALIVSILAFGFGFGIYYSTVFHIKQSFIKFFDDVFFFRCCPVRSRQPNDLFLLALSIVCIWSDQEKWIFYFKHQQHFALFSSHTHNSWITSNSANGTQTQKLSIDTINRQPFRKLWRFLLEMKKKKTLNESYNQFWFSKNEKPSHIVGIWLYSWMEPFVPLKLYNNNNRSWMMRSFFFHNDQLFFN